MLLKHTNCLPDCSMVFECVKLLPVLNLPFSMWLIKSTQTQWLAFAGTHASLSRAGASWFGDRAAICWCCFLRRAALLISSKLTTECGWRHHYSSIENDSRKGLQYRAGIKSLQFMVIVEAFVVPHRWNIASCCIKNKDGHWLIKGGNCDLHILLLVNHIK